MGWIITAIVLFLLAILPLGVSVVYNADGPLVRVIAGPLKFKVFPGKKKDPDAPPKVKEKKEKKPAKPSKPKEENAQPKGGSVKDFLPFVRIAFDFLADFRRKLRVKHFKLKYILAGGDPADLAIKYGKTWAAIGNLWPRLESWFVINHRDVEVECDFQESETLIDLRVNLSITLGRIVSMVVRHGIRALKAFLNFRKKRNGGKTI